MKNKLIACVMIATASLAWFKPMAQSLPPQKNTPTYPPMSDCMRAYQVTITGEKTTGFSFVTFYKHAKDKKEEGVYFYGTNDLQWSGTSFEGYGGTPPNGESLEKQDKGSVEHLLDKKKIAHPKGITLKSISCSEAKEQYKNWFQEGQPK